MALFTHEFQAPLSSHGVGKSRVIWYLVLFMPLQLAAELPFSKHPRLRVRGEIVDIPVSGAWMPTGDGRRYFIVSPAVRKGTGARLGDILDMRFIVDDQDRVEIPPTLKDALATKPELLAVWQGLTPGKARGLAHLVAQAKTSATEERRIKDVMARLSCIA